MTKIKILTPSITGARAIPINKPSKPSYTMINKMLQSLDPVERSNAKALKKVQDFYTIPQS